MLSERTPIDSEQPSLKVQYEYDNFFLDLGNKLLYSYANETI